ncbi:class I SAM-dependent methyltransferase [Desulfonatronum thiodismutans]|uniref:class I SAM-dependent methyltransferase n=1 Tax=Desulfonatronum thiodismutans TaxID=159290 RepID=UPI0004ABD42A|nr:class I SAM-dependent methyltransferase [Desulfonatronum thiodismutans]
MTQSWREIWNKRTAHGKLNLADLINLDGFDSGAGKIAVEDWRLYAFAMASKLGLRDGHSIYEVGCGAGAFLFALRERLKLSIGGLDYASGLIQAACSALPDGHFEERTADSLEVCPQYDFVISNGVFHYFDMAIGAKVLEKMIRKARIAVAVMEIPDLAHKDSAEAIRRDALSQQEYEKKYAGLEHTYYSRSWFIEQARGKGLSCEVFDGCVPNYAQNCFRFGVMISVAR